MDDEVGHVLIREPYSRRIALAAPGHGLAVGLVHSHPRGFQPVPSSIDDDMDSYYGEKYLRGFAPERPFVSLIFALQGDDFIASGRVHWQGAWHAVKRIVIERTPVRVWTNGRSPRNTPRRERTARLSSAFGAEASERLGHATVAVIGAGGTGSAAVEVLARAGVGRLIVVDRDHTEESNLERVHGSVPGHAAERTLKVIVARDHVNAIAPECLVIAISGALPQPEVVDAVAGADVILGCTDTQHGRLALSDLAIRYLVPAIVGVALEGEDGAVTAQVMQFGRYLAADPCPRCRGMITQWRLNQELMSPEERDRRRADALDAKARGAEPTAYWRDEPQLNTVGYLTTAAGALAAGYAIGWITGRFGLKRNLLEASLLLPSFTPRTDVAREGCDCTLSRGLADQGGRHALITAPAHWPTPVLM